MAKQTFTTGQVLTSSQMTSLQATALGGGATTAKTASYVLVAADAGTVVQMNSASATTITVNTALFAAGDTVQIQNVGAGVCTVTAGTATVSTAGSLALSQYEGGQLYFNTTSAALFFDIVQTSGMTNPMTTTGDIIYSSSGSTPARLGIGTTGQVLNVASGLPAWATASSGSMTLLSTTTLSGAATITISSISQSYTNLYILITGLTVTTGTYTLKIKPNSADTSSYTSLAGGTAADVSQSYINPGNAGHSASSAVNDYALTFFNYTDTTNNKPFSLFGIAKMASQIEPLPTNALGAFKSASAISSLAFNNDSGGNFTAGTVKIYGVN